MINPETIQPYKDVPYYYGEVVFILEDFKIDNEMGRVYFYAKGNRKIDRSFESVPNFLAKLIPIDDYVEPPTPKTRYPTSVQERINKERRRKKKVTDEIRFYLTVPKTMRKDLEEIAKAHSMEFATYMRIVCTREIQNNLKIGTLKR